MCVENTERDGREGEGEGTEKEGGREEEEKEGGKNAMTPKQLNSGII